MKVSDIFTVKKIEQDYSVSTLAKRYRILRSMLSHAMRQQYIDKNFATGDYIDSIKEVNTPKEILDDVEIRELLARLENYPNRQAKAAIKIAILSGVRRGELCGLEWVG